MGAFSRDRIERAVRNPRLFLRHLNRLYHRRLNTRSYNTAGVDIMEEDWDNLLLLDACRYDMLEEQANLPGTLESRISRGSATVEFLTANLQNKNLHDTVYVTANPQLYRHNEDINASFYAIEEVWQTEGWDKEHRTVLPETMVEHTIEAAEKYPNKRLFVHFIQPHYPFLTGEENPFDNDQAFLKPDEPGSWDQLMTKEITASKEGIWKAYRETLNQTLPHIDNLINVLSGKTVVTADHGNMVGERATPIPITEWGHPRGIYTRELVKVPWLVVEDTRKNITNESPLREQEGVTDEVVNNRLEDLGYM